MATISAGAALGTAPPAPTITPTVQGTGGEDLRGTISLGTGTVPAAGNVAAVTFAEALNQIPTVIVEPASQPADGFEWGVNVVTNTGFFVTVGAALAASQPLGTYVLEYEVLEQPG